MVMMLFLKPLQIQITSDVYHVLFNYFKDMFCQFVTCKIIIDISLKIKRVMFFIIFIIAAMAKTFIFFLIIYFILTIQFT